MPSAVEEADTGEAETQGAARRWFMLTVAWLTAFSSRSPILAVGPVLPLMVTDLHMSYAQAGLVFGTPQIMMGLFAVPGGLIIGKLGVKSALLISLMLIGIGGALRATAGGGGVLLFYTVILGAGIGLVQPALPRLVKDWFPSQAGFGTAVYANGFSIGAVLATGLAVPVLLPLSGKLAWRGPFLLWSALVFLTAAAIGLVRGSNSPASGSLAPVRKVIRNPLCWQVAGIFMGQSMLFYTLNSWMAGYYLGAGGSLNEGSTALAVLSLTGIVSGSLAPYVSDRLGSRKPMLICGAAACVVGVAGLALWPHTATWLWPGVLGFAISILFSICLLMPIDAASGEDLGAFSGLVFGIGYLGVGAGPAVVGLLRDVTGTAASGLPALMAMSLGALWLCAVTPETKGMLAVQPTRPSAACAPPVGGRAPCS